MALYKGKLAGTKTETSIGDFVDGVLFAGETDTSAVARLTGARVAVRAHVSRADGTTTWTTLAPLSTINDYELLAAAIETRTEELQSRYSIETILETDILVIPPKGVDLETWAEALPPTLWTWTPPPEEARAALDTADALLDMLAWARGIPEFRPTLDAASAALAEERRSIPTLEEVRAAEAEERKLRARRKRDRARRAARKPKARKPKARKPKGRKPKPKRPKRKARKRRTR